MKLLFSFLFRLHAPLRRHFHTWTSKILSERCVNVSVSTFFFFPAASAYTFRCTSLHEIFCWRWCSHSVKFKVGDVGERVQPGGRMWCKKCTVKYAELHLQHVSPGGWVSLMTVFVFSLKQHLLNICRLSKKNNDAHSHIKWATFTHCLTGWLFWALYRGGTSLQELRRECCRHLHSHVAPEHLQTISGLQRSCENDLQEEISSRSSICLFSREKGKWKTPLWEKY